MINQCGVTLVFTAFMKSIYYTGLNTSNGQEKVILNINIIKTNL